jgi:hypothetical protein
MITLERLLHLQQERNQMYIDACNESRRASNNARHDALQQAAHPERTPSVVGGYEGDRLTETWARYHAFCAEVDAAKTAYRTGGGDDA